MDRLRCEQREGREIGSIPLHTPSTGSLAADQSVFKYSVHRNNWSILLCCDQH